MMESERTGPLVALSLDAGALADGQLDPHRWLELVLAAEAAGVGLVTLGDAHGPGGGPRLDAALLAAWLAPRTRTIGLVPEINTTVSEPFLVASQLSTLDIVSGGRGGWLAQVSAAEADAGYVGPRPAAVGDAGWAEAAEYAEVLSRLWDSWEDGAEIRDIEGHRFLDAARVHYIDFEGAHLSVKGPSITPRPPQGRPPLAVAVGADPRALALAAGAADLVFVTDGADPAAVGAAVAAAGRSADAVRILADVAVGAAVDADVLLEEALSRGYDGVRLLAAALPVLLSPIGTAPGITGEGEVRQGGPTLRGRLGLERPRNRYADCEARA